ncbi:MAG: hypothetical protein K0R51_2698 [Cytophagaceae bacterium]|jgi:hypothetical protein|nr:hypothetical protein [Cytophagaceae bacterium]
MKSLSLLLLFVLGLTACNKEDQSRPASILPQEKMVVILADIHQTEGIISTKEYSKDSSLLLFTELENQLLAKHGVSKKEFKETYSWYTSHVKEYKELYTIVVDTLNVRTSEGKVE